MEKTGLAVGREVQGSGQSAMTLSELRHDFRNHLNAIKLSSALLQRRHKDAATLESLREMDRAADGINELITRFLGDADAPSSFGRL